EYWNNDSFWIDLGFPVLTSPGGRKYKPLFAALVTDLDNRVNVNVHGNTTGQNFEHRSNQGLGPWEVCLKRVLAPARGGSAAAARREWRTLLRGTATPPLPGRHGGAPWQGRFGTPGFPGEVAPAGQAPHFYSQVDFDGGNETTGKPSDPLRLPDVGYPLSP